MSFVKRWSVLLAMAVCVALGNGCTPAEDESGTGAAPPAPETVTVSTPEAPQMTEPEPAPEPEETMADRLFGTTWAIADYTVTFEEGGVVRFNSGSEGTWTLGDGTITISVGGEQTVITIEGDQLMHDGMALERQ